jgi:hypothetical protein
MDRKEFIITVWKKGIKPLLLIGIIFLCGKFLYNVFAESGAERSITILIIGLGLLILTLYFIGLFFKSLTKKLNSILPEPIKLWIRIVGNFLNEIALIIIGMILYHFGKEDWGAVTIFLGVFLIRRILEIIKEEKLAKKI